MSECVCDVCCFYGTLSSVVCMVCTDWSVIRDGTTSDVHDKTGECLAWAKCRIRSCSVAYLFASYGILLVSERQGGIRDVTDVHFIQRSRRGESSDATDGIFG